MHVPSRIYELLKRLRAHLRGMHISISDRRLLKAVRLMQVAAYSLGATELVEVDLLVLKHVLWDELPTWLSESCDVADEEEALKSLQRCLRESHVKATTARGRLKELLASISSLVHHLCVEASSFRGLGYLSLAARSLLQKLELMKRVVEEKVELWSNAEASRSLNRPGCIACQLDFRPPSSIACALPA